jgi:uncharacterized membrane protein YfcA
VVDLLLLAALGAAVFALAALAQAITGFGSALVAVPLLALATEPVAAVVAATAVGLVITSGAGWQERAYVDVPVARTLTLTGIVGMPAGLLLLEVVDESRLEVWIAGAMLVMVLLVTSGLRIGDRGTPFAGLVSGALLTSAGMNGPPLVMALVDREPRRYRATLQAVFAVQDAVAVAAFVILGHFDLDAALLTAGGIVGIPLGWRLGDAVFHRIPAARLRPIINVSLGLAALSMLVGALA